MKRKAFVLVAVLSVFILFGISEVNAAWYTCDVTGTGAAGSSVLVRLTDTAATPAFTNKWFSTNSANVTETNRVLACLLTAMSLEKTVMISVANLTDTYPKILNFYLYK